MKEHLTKIEILLLQAKKDLSEDEFRTYTEQVEQIMVRLVFNLPDFKYGDMINPKR